MLAFHCHLASVDRYELAFYKTSSPNSGLAGCLSTFYIYLLATRSCLQHTCSYINASSPPDGMYLKLCQFGYVLLMRSKLCVCKVEECELAHARRALVVEQFRNRHGKASY